MLYQLPNGLIEGVDLFNYADIDELRGKQQNYLLNRDLVIGNIGHISKILEDLVLSLQTKEGLIWKGNTREAIWKLSSGDLETLIIRIREYTYGPRFYIEAECPHCEHTNKNLRLDLDKLELKVMPIEELIIPKKLLLPKSNIEIELKPLYLKDLFEFIKITTNKKDTLVTSLLSISIKRFNNKDKVTTEDIENLPASDICFLQDKMENIKLEGSIDSDIEVNCSGCNKEFKTRLNIYDASFFDHTKGSTTSNM